MIGVSSQVGQGSTFSIHLPVVENLEPFDDEVLSKSVDGAGCRVLCVDDEASIVDVTERLLKRLGFVVTGMTDPVMGAAIFERAPSDFDVVMVDYFMPKLTGLELIRKDLPIILSSGNIDENIRKAAHRDGVEVFLDKPYSNDALSSALQQALASGKE